LLADDAILLQASRYYTSLARWASSVLSESVACCQRRSGSTAVQRTGVSPMAHSRARSACASRPQRARGQRSGRHRIRARSLPPITCRDRCRWKEPLRSHQRSGRGRDAVQRRFM